VTELASRSRVDTVPGGGTPSSRRARRVVQAWRSGRIAQWLFIAPAAAYLAIFFAYPILRNIATSLQNYSITTIYSGQAPFAGLQNYRQILHSGIFGQIVTNTAIFTIGSMLGQFVIGLSLALFFHRQFPLNKAIRSLLLLPWLLPLVVSSTVWRWMFDQANGVINNALLNLHIVSSPVPWLVSNNVSLISVIIVNIWVGIPFNMVILYSGLQNIPLDIYEAATIDGASAASTFRRITWPLLRPVVGVVVVLGFIYTAKVLDIILVVTGGGPVSSSTTLAIGSYNLSFKTFLFGQGAAMGNVLILASLVFAAIYLRINRRAFSDGNAR
jgi:multiple sugar transport system permease protein